MNIREIAAWVGVFILFFSPFVSAYSYTFFQKASIGTVELDLTQADMSIERIYFDIYGQEEQYKVIVTKLESNISRIQDYFVINASGLTNDISEISFFIRVNKTWSEKNSVNLDTISFGYYEDSWETIPIFPVSEDTEYYHYLARPPILESVFAIYGEIVPVEININIQCNENGFCESELGEDRENCPDCLVLDHTYCAPSEKYCVDENLFVCTSDGNSYELEECEFGCSGKACLASGSAPFTGMAITLNPVFLGVITILLSTILFLGLVVRKMRRQVMSTQDRRNFHGDAMELAKRERNK